MSGATKLMTAGGGGVSLTPASSIASDVTVNVPSQNCTLGIQGPAFAAYQSSAQNVSNATFTKITLDTELFDIENCFSNSRFTPNVAGYYQVNVTLFWNFTSSGGISLASIVKNNSEYIRTYQLLNTTNAACCGTGSAVIYFNGSTDYIEFHAFQNAGGTNPILAGTYTQASASLVRAA